MDTFGFGNALMVMKAGGQVSRTAWSGASSVHLDCVPDPPHAVHIQFTLTTPAGATKQYTPAIHDILADDWIVTHYPHGDHHETSHPSLHREGGRCVRQEAWHQGERQEGREARQEPRLARRKTDAQRG